MKHLCASILLTAICLGGAGSALGAGPLNPPGPPAPTMKTLDEVEPRRPISSLPFVINQPGSYYVTTNLTGGAGQNGITIASDCVTLDLMGFELRGVAGSLSGILLNLGSRAYIYNGCLRNWGQDGISGNNSGNSCVLERLRLVNNGRDGLIVGGGSQVRQCVAAGNLRNGIVAGNDSDVDDCTSITNAARGIQVGSGSNVRRSLAAANVTGGINAGDGSSVIGCNANDTGITGGGNAPGILVNGGCTVRDCTTRNNSGNGITASFGCNIANNSCRDNLGNNIEVQQECLVSQNACDDDTANRGQSGIRVTGNNNRIDHNTVTETIRGLWITSAENEVIGNTVLRNFTNYVIVAGNQLNILLGQIPETIPWAAHVELSGTLRGIAGANGITILTNDVTIDLKGHALVGVASSLDGISVSGNRTNIVIRNGNVRGWGSDGIQASSSYNSSFSDLRVANNVANGLHGGNGAVIKCVTARANRGIGITTSTGCTITDSTSSENTLDGIVASTGSTVSSSSAYNNGRTGISASTGSTVVHCTAYSNTNGISASSGSTVRGCTATANSTNGILAAFGSTISDCTARDNLTGINVGEDCRVVNNTCDQNSPGIGTAILVRTSGNRIDGNNVNEHATGIRVLAAGNLIIRNSAFGNTDDYNIVAGNAVGEIVVTGAGLTLTEVHGPWANFEF